MAGYWRKASRNGNGEELKTPAFDRLRLQGRKKRSRSDTFQLKIREKLAMTLKSLWRDFPRRSPCLQSRGVILGRWGWLSCEVRVKVGGRGREVPVQLGLPVSIPHHLWSRKHRSRRSRRRISSGRRMPFFLSALCKEIPFYT